MTDKEKWMLGIIVVETGALAYFAYQWHTTATKVKKFMKTNPSAGAVPVAELPKAWVTAK